MMNSMTAMDNTYTVKWTYVCYKEIKASSIIEADKIVDEIDAPSPTDLEFESVEIIDGLDA